MNNDIILDNALNLTNIADTVKPREYFRSRLPNPTDGEIMEICTSVMEETSEDRRNFVSLIDKNALSLLDMFGHRMTMLSVRKNSYDHLLVGLIALIFSATQRDYREILMTVSLFYQSAIKLNADPEQLFVTASQYATSESVRDFVLRFLKRSPENKGIDKMGFTEVNGPNGLVYQFGSQPIPDGWL